MANSKRSELRQKPGLMILTATQRFNSVEHDFEFAERFLGGTRASQLLTAPKSILGYKSTTTEHTFKRLACLT